MTRADTTRGHAQSHGPWPLVTHYAILAVGRRVFLGARQLCKESRNHLQEVLVDGPVRVWRRRGYNMAVATLFASGSVLYRRWKPRDLDWQIVASNLVGYTFFMRASTLAFVPDGYESWWLLALANLHLLLGGLGFLTGSLLMIREGRLAQPTGRAA